MRNLLIILLLISCHSLIAQRADKETANSDPRIILVSYATGFSNPVAIQNMGDDRLFIVEQEGVIKIILNNTTLATPFLDISTQVTFNGQQGLLGLAFHPDYSNNGFLFLNYINNDGNTQISRFTVSENPDVTEVSSELEILTIIQPFSNNNGGDLKFGPDGYLWIGNGDGGSAGDPQNHAQNLNSLLGKMLRIDIDNVANGNNYAIPADNPYIGNPDALDEIWAYGLKNPRKFSFDDDTNEVWITDGGQNNKIELNKVSANTTAINYGWSCYENNNPYEIDGCPSEDTMTFPFLEYDQPNLDCTKIGGIKYNGTEYWTIEDAFFFADNCNGTIVAILPDNYFFIDGVFSETFTAFGEDSENRLYIASTDGAINEIIIVWLEVEEFNKVHFKITPNPATENLQLDLDNIEIDSIRIYNLKGTIVYSEENRNASNMTINISLLKSGLYIIKATTIDGISSSKKLVIK